MVNLPLLMLMEAKPRKEGEGANFLRGGLTMVEEEPATWFGLSNGIFDTFQDESGRQAHLSGRRTAALMAKAPDLFAPTPREGRAQ